MSKSTIKINVDRKNNRVTMEIGQWKAEISVRTRSNKFILALRWLPGTSYEELGNFWSTDKAMEMAFEAAHAISLGTSFAMLRRKGEPVSEMSTRDIIELSGCSVAWVYRALGITPKPAFAHQ